MHRPPRDFGFETSIWTLKLVAVACVKQGWIDYQVSNETIRQALKRVGINWKRAKHWISSPDPLYLKKKMARDRLIAWASLQPGWVIGFLDEVWWSRFALPRLNAWQERDQPVRLVEQVWQKGDPDPKALACSGVLWKRVERFHSGNTARFPGLALLGSRFLAILEISPEGHRSSL